MIMDTIHFKDPGFEDYKPDRFGSIPTILIILAVICTLGYLTNVMEMGHTHAISDALRGFGTVFPPLGVLLGFMQF